MAALRFSRSLTIGILFAMLFLLAMSVTQHAAINNQRQVGATTMRLQSADLDRVEELVRDGRTLTDQELRELVTRQLRNVLATERPQQRIPTSGIRETMALLLPTWPGSL
jgi:hypothetical protein